MGYKEKELSFTEIKRSVIYQSGGEYAGEMKSLCVTVEAWKRPFAVRR